MNQINNNILSIGQGFPCFIIAEIGINHNGDINLAKQLIFAAKEAGCDAVKFQKREPEICVPKDQWHIERDTPWGRMDYISYRHKIEFSFDEFAELNDYCKSLDLIWFASCWDEVSVDFIEAFDPPIYKSASASLMDIELLAKMKSTHKPLIVSTGMSTLDDIHAVLDQIGKDNVLLAHATSAYPCPIEDLNLKMISTFQKLFPDNIIGYSGHETGLSTTLAAVTLGAKFVERHFTLDRAMWGSDQSASVEPVGMQRLVRDIRANEKAFGDGIKKIYPSEYSSMDKLRKIKSVKPRII